MGRAYFWRSPYVGHQYYVSTFPTEKRHWQSSTQLTLATALAGSIDFLGGPTDLVPI